MIKQRWLWLGLFSIVAAAAWSHAQDPDESFGQRLHGTEIWRLPPVNDFSALTPSGRLDIAFQTPKALVLPHYKMLPAPRPEAVAPEAVAPQPAPSTGEVPAAPSDVPLGEERFNEKPQRKKLWSGSFDLGLDGSEGNTETFNFRFGVHTQRKTKCNILTLGLDFNKQASKTVPTEDRLYFDGRYEQLLGLSRWSAFFHETIEYDQFQPFDVRDTSDIGIGYRIIDWEGTTLIGRLGGGFSHEYGGPENGKYFPEAVFGLQFERQISKRQKFIGTMEYAPDVTRFARYRLRTQAAWEVLLDEDRNLNLRIGLLERYNSVPNGARPNDLDYAMMLMWKF